MRQLTVLVFAVLYSLGAAAHPLPAAEGQMAAMVHTLVSPHHPLLMAMLLIAGIAVAGATVLLRSRKS